ncbi:MAG TPA: DUF308 domain-containing protein [Labilithrix sp.]|nr:DUF308 domain-containing protein [Labilithrix sp.]
MAKAPWKLLVVRGLAAALFGAVALLGPGMTLPRLVLVFGAYAFVDGALAVAASGRDRNRRRAWAFALEGVLGIAMGVSALMITGGKAVLLVPIVGAWAIATGILELTTAAELTRDTASEPSLAVAGLLSTLFGVALFLWPSAPGFVLVMALGVYGIVFGAALLGAGLRARRPPAVRMRQAESTPGQ